MGRPFHFVDHCHSIILRRDAALPMGITQHLIRPEPELPGAPAGSEVSCSMASRVPPILLSFLTVNLSWTSYTRYLDGSSPRHRRSSLRYPASASRSSIRRCSKWMVPAASSAFSSSNSLSLSEFISVAISRGWLECLKNGPECNLVLRGVVRAYTSVAWIESNRTTHGYHVMS